MSPELKAEWMKFKRSNAASAAFVLKLDSDNLTVVLDTTKTCSPEVKIGATHTVSSQNYLMARGHVRLCVHAILLNKGFCREG